MSHFGRAPQKCLRIAQSLHKLNFADQINNQTKNYQTTHIGNKACERDWLASLPDALPNTYMYSQRSPGTDIATV